MPPFGKALQARQSQGFFLSVFTITSHPRQRPLFSLVRMSHLDEKISGRGNLTAAKLSLSQEQ
jgi:hypothetical protein